MIDLDQIIEYYKPYTGRRFFVLVFKDKQTLLSFVKTIHWDDKRDNGFAIKSCRFFLINSI